MVTKVKIELEELKKLCQQEGLILDVTELAAKLMEEKKINHTKLAELLNVSRMYVVHFFDGSANFTLRQVTDIFTALDSELVVTCKELK